MANLAPIIIIKKKKGGGHGGHHGGAWKVAYADFVTAMMAFFMVMWLMGADEETKAEIAHYFNHPNSPFAAGRDPTSTTAHPLGEKNGEGDSVLSGADGLIPDELVQTPSPRIADQTEAALKAQEALSEEIQKILEDLAYDVEVNADYLKFSIPESVLFTPGTTHLKPSATKYLTRLAPVLRDYRGFIQIAGHTDGTDIREDLFEFTTSQAVTVMHFFTDSLLVPEEKMFPAGESTRKPFAVTTAANPAQVLNRRIEFTLSRTQRF